MTRSAPIAPRSSPLREQTTLAASAGRIYGLVLRYWYVIRSSWPRTAELIYWPLVQMLMWGFLQSYLAQTTSFAAKAAGLFIGAHVSVLGLYLPSSRPVPPHTSISLPVHTPLSQYESGGWPF